MRRSLVIFLLFIISEFDQANGLKLVQIDPPQILSLFDQSNGYKNLLIENTNVHTKIETKVQITAFFEEQCAIECLRNLQCVRYTYDQVNNLCKINIQSNVGRRIKFSTIEQQTQISKDLNCDLSQCSQGFYCSANIAKTGACLCKPGDKSKDCSGNLGYQYGLDKWTEWTECTANCNQNKGFRQKTKKCMKNYFNGTSSTDVHNMDWLCNKGSLSDQFQIESCSIEKCREYTDWSPWTPCSKICGGFTSRKRECFKSSACDTNYLNQIKECTLTECDSLLIGKLI